MFFPFLDALALSYIISSPLPSTCLLKLLLYPNLPIPFSRSHPASPPTPFPRIITFSSSNIAAAPSPSGRLLACACHEPREAARRVSNPFRYLVHQPPRLIEWPDGERWSEEAGHIITGNKGIFQRVVKSMGRLGNIICYLRVRRVGVVSVSGIVSLVLS